MQYHSTTNYHRTKIITKFENFEATLLTYRANNDNADTNDVLFYTQVTSIQLIQRPA